MLRARKRDYSYDQGQQVRGGRNIPAPTFTILEPNAQETNYVYLDIAFSNETDFPIRASYSETRLTPFLDNPSEYKMAVSRFNVDLVATPMFLIRRGFFVGFRYTPDGIETIREVYVNLPVGTPIRSIEAYLYQAGGFNDTLAAAFADMMAAYDVIHGPGSWAANILLPQVPPFVILNEASGLMSFYADSRMSGQTNSVLLLLPGDFGSLFAGIDFNIGNITFPPGNPNGLVVPFIINGLGSNVTTVGGIDYVSNTQEFNSSHSWREIDRILILSNTLTNRFQDISVTTNSINLSFPVIADFVLDTSNVAGRTPSDNVISNSQGGLRWIDLLGHDSLQTIDIRLATLSNTGLIQDLFLGPSQTFGLTLIFAKKTF